MELIDLYNIINNPLKDQDVLKKVIDIYADGIEDDRVFYSRINSIEKKQYKDGEYLIRDYEKFYSTIFNKWKNNIVNITDEDYIDMYKKGKIDEDFLKLRDYLKTIEDVKTKEEADYILYRKMLNPNFDSEIKRAMQKYRWTRVGEDTSWTHVCSKEINGYKEDYQNVEHRLYINTESVDLYNILNLFIEKCDDKKLPYYFKFDDMASRDDTIVIYSSTENLAKYVEALQEIKKENPTLESKVKNPPLLTGRIDNWIGYGSESSLNVNGKTDSYNEIRTQIIMQTLNEKTKEWIIKNKDINVKYNNQELTMLDYISIKSIENNLKRNNENVSFDYIKKIYNDNKSSINDLIINICNENSDIDANIKMSTLNDKEITIYKADIEKVIKKTTPVIYKTDSNYGEEVLKEIKEKASKKEIDPNNFCFDIAMLKKIEDYDRQIILEARKEYIKNIKFNERYLGINSNRYKLNKNRLHKVVERENDDSYNTGKTR